MNDVEFFTKKITIIVKLDGYYDNCCLEDFVVTIKAGDNETKVVGVTKQKVHQLASKGLYTIFYEGLDYFTLDNLKITCKYPVVVRCADFIFSKYIEPTTDNKNTQIALMDGAGDTLELEGTKKQIEAFEAERKKRNDALFPRALSFVKSIELALEHGLTVKKVTTRK